MVRALDTPDKQDLRKLQLLKDELVRPLLKTAARCMLDGFGTLQVILLDVCFATHVFNVSLFVCVCHQSIGPTFEPDVGERKVNCWPETSSIDRPSFLHVPQQSSTYKTF